MKPGTYPAEPIDGQELVSKALTAEVPKPLWNGDWLVNLENDIKFLDNHFQSGVGDYLWIREGHRLHLKDPDGRREVHVEYSDGDTRKTNLFPEQMPFESGRKIPAMGMFKEACRFVLRVREIETRWADTDKRTRLYWAVGIERMPDAEHILELEKRKCLQ